MSYMKALACAADEVRNPLLRCICKFQIGQHVQGKRPFEKLHPVAQQIVREWENEMLNQLDYERAIQASDYYDPDELEDYEEQDHNHHLRMQIWQRDEMLLKEEAPELYQALKSNIERTEEEKDLSPDWPVEEWADW